MSNEMRICGECGGTGETTNWKEEKEVCTVCAGTKQIGLDTTEVTNIIKKITTSRGGDYRLKAGKPCGFATQFERRCYFVWRLARFHGGADVTMPMVAEMMIHKDAWLKELDALAGIVAKRFFKTDLAGACRWGGLLGLAKESVLNAARATLPEPAGMIMGVFAGSGHEGGPVLTGDAIKPDIEAGELL